MRILRAVTVTTAELELIGCFSSFEQAIEVGSGGLVDIAPTESPATLTDGDLTVSVAAADVLIGTEYNLVGYGGPRTATSRRPRARPSPPGRCPTSPTRGTISSLPGRGSAAATRIGSSSTPISGGR